MSEQRNEADRAFLGAWDFLTALAAIIAITSASIVITGQVADARDALAMLSIVVMGIVSILVSTTLVKLVRVTSNPVGDGLDGAGRD